MYQTKAYSATSATAPLAGTTIARRDPTEHDVQIEFLFCGICRSDLHSVRNEWSEFMPTVYPIVPGHEIVGRIAKIGSAVTRYKPGDLAAVGCLVDSDRICPRSLAGLENFCPNLRLTFSSTDSHLGGVTYGGYSDSIVVDERFVLSVPSNLPLAGAAPLLCAGITTYSPTRRHGVGECKKVGVVGLGGLGHPPDDHLRIRRKPTGLAGGTHQGTDGVDAVVFTLGSDGAGKIGVTNRTGEHNRSTESHDWTRRSERLGRACGLPYTIVWPGWFDYNSPDEHRLVLLQGDTRQAGDSSDGVIARRQIAEVLVRSLGSDLALRKTFELVATTGPAPDDFDALFAPLDAALTRRAS